jgi:hypothetical protein
MSTSNSGIGALSGARKAKHFVLRVSVLVEMETAI